MSGPRTCTRGRSSRRSSSAAPFGGGRCAPTRPSGSRQKGKKAVEGAAGGAGPWINATHPGAVATDQLSQAVEAYGLLANLAVKVLRLFMKDPVDQGCRSMLFVETSDAVVGAEEGDGVDGEYIVPDCKVTEPSKLARDEELRERCWNLVEGVLRDRLAVAY